MKRVAALLLFGLLASACRIDVDLRLNLQPDGSGDLDLNITTDEEFERLYRFTNAELEEFIVLSGQDIGLAFEVTEGTNKTYHADAPGLSPESIQRVLENLIPDLGTVDINAVEETLVFSGDFRPLPESQILDPFFENFDAAELAESAGITLTMTVPGDVEISSASQREGNTLTYEIPFDYDPIRVFARTRLIPEGSGAFPWGLTILAVVVVGALAFLVSVRMQAGRVTQTILDPQPPIPYAPEDQPVAPPPVEEQPWFEEIAELENQAELPPEVPIDPDNLPIPQTPGPPSAPEAPPSP